MALFDSLLSLIGLLLWLNWLSIRFDPLSRTRAMTLLGNLKRTGKSGARRWLSLSGLIILLFGRALLHWLVSRSVNWTPRLDFGVVAISFRDENLAQILVYSFLGFGIWLAGFYFWLLLLSVLNRSLSEDDPIQKLVRLHIRWLEGWPAILKLLVPLFVGAASWVAIHPLLRQLDVVPPVRTWLQLFEQSGLIGVESWLLWKYLILGILLVYVVNSYVFLGNHPVWNYIDTTARNLLAPLKGLPLRIGKVDLLPLVVGVVVLFLAEFLANPTRWLRGLTLPF
jgi:uncharacterized protein YggT (Ycf19 family)